MSTTSGVFEEISASGSYTRVCHRAPYLTALWSIKCELDPVTKSIREIVQEEMLHVALACNMLASLGEEPQIATTVPQYPSALPGGVHEGLVVLLMGLTKESLANFLWIASGETATD